jgi:CBS domain-containing protein
MKVKDVMSRHVVSVRPEASLKEAARLLVERNISGLPVVDRDGGLVGVLSEEDVLYKEQGKPDTPGRLAFMINPLALAGSRKLGARLVGEAMTTPPLTVGSNRPVAAAAKLMLGAHVKRLPVVDDGKLVGIVTRADLVRAFVRGDDEIDREIRQELLARRLRIAPDRVHVTVTGGVVALSGVLETRAEAEDLPALVRRVPGVVDVEAELAWSGNDPDC